MLQSIKVGSNDFLWMRFARKLSLSPRLQDVMLVDWWWRLTWC
jgi:hypothetical protein